MGNEQCTSGVCVYARVGVRIGGEGVACDNINISSGIVFHLGQQYR